MYLYLLLLLRCLLFTSWHTLYLYYVISSSVPLKICKNRHSYFLLKLEFIDSYNRIILFMHLSFLSYDTIASPLLNPIRYILECFPVTFDISACMVSENKYWQHCMRVEECILYLAILRCMEYRFTYTLHLCKISIISVPHFTSRYVRVFVSLK